MPKVTEIREMRDGTVQMYVELADIEVAMAIEDWVSLAKEIIEKAEAYPKDKPGSGAGCWYCGMPKGTHKPDCPENKK